MPPYHQEPSTRRHICHLGTSLLSAPLSTGQRSPAASQRVSFLRWARASAGQLNRDTTSFIVALCVYTHVHHPSRGTGRDHRRPSSTRKRKKKTFFREIMSPPFPHFNSDMSSFDDEFPSPKKRIFLFFFFTSCRQSFFFCFHRQNSCCWIDGMKMNESNQATVQWTETGCCCCCCDGVFSFISSAAAG